MKSEKKTRRKLSWVAKIVVTLVGIALVAALIWLGYYLVHYQFYNRYRDYLDSYEVEEGSPYEAISESAGDVEGMELAAENDVLKLYTNPETAEVAVYDKRNHTTIYSNPQQAEEDPIANRVNKNYLRSQFVLDYYNASRTAGTYDSYSMSVEKGQVEMQSLQDGVRYIYTLGEEASISYYVPYYLSGEWYEKIQSQVDESDMKTVQRLYSESATVENGYELIAAARSNKKSQAKLDTILQAVGFTEDDYYEQMALGGDESAIPMSFSVTLDYRLKEDGVEVSIPVSAIEEHGGGKVYRIQLLRCFGAAGTDEEGYLVLPNGSGSLIYFNNGKTNTASYSQYIYGMDLIDADYTVLENTENARLPLYGICREDSSVLATIENGETLSYITADIAGKYNSYNYAFPTFILRGYSNLTTFGAGGTSADLPILEPEMYDENLTVRYTMLTEEYQGYSGIANYYRERLIQEGKLTPKTEGGDIPFYYDVIGGVKRTATILGAQYQSVYPMTTFEEADQMIDSFNEKGISNQVINYQGWFNGGYYHDVADKIKILRKLGSKKELEELSEKIEQQGGHFYVDTALQKVTHISKRFQENAEASRYYGSGYTAVFGQVSPTSLRRTSSLNYIETIYSLLSPKYLPRYVDKIADKIQNVDVAGIALRDLGDQLHADKKRTNVISRQQALDVVEAQFDTLAATGKRLMVSGGNSYSFPYATDIINAPIQDNDYFLVDEEIPLYQMLIHGCIDYAGKYQNLSNTSDEQADILQMIEYGASCHYIFTWEDAVEMRETGLNGFYSTTFSLWEEKAAQTYQQINEALKPVSNAQMTAHEKLDNGISKVTYSNGVILYINHSENDQSADGITVLAKNYVIGGVSNE